MKIDPQRMAQLWHLLEAAEDRFCGPDEFTYQGALHSFSIGLRGVMQRAGERVDIVEAKRYFGVLLKEKHYAFEISDPEDVGGEVLGCDPRVRNTCTNLCTGCSSRRERSWVAKITSEVCDPLQQQLLEKWALGQL